jgi:hypothetical protein
MEISFEGTEITPDVLRSLEASTALEKLVIWGGPLTTAELEPLSRLTQLKSLVLGEMRLDDGIFLHLQPLRRLEHLNLAYTGVQGDFSPLAGLPLKDVRLEGCRFVTDACAKSLASFPSLRQLEIHMTGLTDDGVAELAELPLEVLWLGPRITDRALRVIGGMPTMKHLDLCAHMVTDEGVAELASLPNLEVLWLSRCSVSDESVAVLSGMHSLKELNVSYTAVSAQGLASLRAAHPHCRLIEPD